MKKRLNQIVRWVSTKGLIWLGFGATPFIFMACYGPVPTKLSIQLMWLRRLLATLLIWLIESEFEDNQTTPP